jgi:hypothetical protein
MPGKLVVGKGVTLVVVPEKEYASKINEIVSAASSSHSRICYTSLSKPCSTLSQSFSKNGIDTKKILFIECGGSSGGESGQVVHVSSPKALTEISIAISKVIDMGKIEILIFDSLSTLLVYADSSTVVKFAHSIITMLRSKGVDGMLMCAKSSQSEAIVKDITMFTDNVME